MSAPSAVPLLQFIGPSGVHQKGLLGHSGRPTGVSLFELIGPRRLFHIIFLLLLILQCHVSIVPTLAAESRGGCLTGRNSILNHRYHLSTSTRYHDALGASGGAQSSAELPLPTNNSCNPFYVYLVSRHGSREPTKKRVKQLNRFSVRLKELATLTQERKKDCTAHSGTEGNTENGRECNVLAAYQSAAVRWMKEFHSPWEGYDSGGQLMEEGEEELYFMGQRLRDRFPSVFDHPYHSQAYPMYSTQVARSAASAVAFGMGMFEGRGRLGLSQSRAFAVISETERIDTKLRFHDLCPGYTAAVDDAQPALDTLWDKVYEVVAKDLADWTGAPFEADDVASLWLLCRQRLEGRFGACDVLGAEHVAALEWVDDVNTFIQKGYGREVNFRMAVPLLEAMAVSLKHAVLRQQHDAGIHVSHENHVLETTETRTTTTTDTKEKKETAETKLTKQTAETSGRLSKSERKKLKKQADAGRLNGVRERAQLHFAHAETVIPMVCLLGLFQEGSSNPHQETDLKDRHSAPEDADGIPGTLLSSGHASVPCSEDVEAQVEVGQPKVNLSALHEAMMAVHMNLKLSETAENGVITSALPPPPPLPRTWMGRDVSPYAANIAISLWECSGHNEDNGHNGNNGENGNSEIRVMVLHNERAVVLPECGDVLCPFDTYMERVVNNHISHSFDTTCRLPPRTQAAPKNKLHSCCGKNKFFSSFFPPWLLNLFSASSRKHEEL